MRDTGAIATILQQTGLVMLRLSDSMT